MILQPDKNQANADWPKHRSKIENWYIEDTGDGYQYISGMPIPRDPDGITRNVDFVDCTFHPASDGVFENCTINGKPIPDGPGCLYTSELRDDKLLPIGMSGDINADDTSAEPSQEHMCREQYLEHLANQDPFERPE